MHLTGLTDLSEEQKKLQGIAREIAQDFRKRAAQADKERRVPPENWKLLKDAGFYGAIIPNDLGGMGLGMFEYGLILEELAQGCAASSMAFNMHQMPFGLMTALGLSGDKKRYLADLTCNHLMSGVASEPGGSSLVLGSITPSAYAEKVSGGYKLYGKKQFGTNFEASEYSMVMFHLKDHPDPTAAIFLIVEPTQEGVTVEDNWFTLGMRATRSNAPIFNGAFVPDERVLMQGTGLFERVFKEASANFYHTFSLVYLGLGAGLLKWAGEFLNERVPRGYKQPLSYHPSSLQTIGDLAVDFDAARLLTRQVSLTYDRYGNTPEVFFGFGKAKLAVTQLLLKAVTMIPAACGANSLYDKHPLGRFIRDAMVSSVMPPAMYFEREFVASGELALDPTKIQPPLS